MSYIRRRARSEKCWRQPAAADPRVSAPGERSTVKINMSRANAILMSAGNWILGASGIRDALNSQDRDNQAERSDGAATCGPRGRAVPGAGAERPGAVGTRTRSRPGAAAAGG